MNFKPALSGLMLLLLSIFFQAPAQSAGSQESSCKDFVQKFYTWYFNKSKSPLPSGMSVTDLALKERGSAFSAELSRLLKQDAAAQARVPGEIVGLDFDPVLNTQAEADRYEVGKVSRRGNNYLVEVYGYWDKKKSSKPDVLPELSLSGGKWQFVNFRYKAEHDDDLISILRLLKAERVKNKVK